MDNTSGHIVYDSLFDEHADAMRKMREKISQTFVCDKCHSMIILGEATDEKIIPKCPRCGKFMSEKQIKTNGKRIEISITTGNHCIRGPVFFVRRSDEKFGQSFVGQNAFAGLVDFLNKVM